MTYFGTNYHLVYKAEPLIWKEIKGGLDLTHKPIKKYIIARQKGILKLKDTIGDITFYDVNGTDKKQKTRKSYDLRAFDEKWISLCRGTPIPIS